MPKMWATLRKEVGLDDPVSFIDQVHLGSTQREAKVNNRIVMDKQKVFSQALDVLTEETKPEDTCDKEGRAQKCVERHCELAHKTVDLIS